MRFLQVALFPPQELQLLVKISGCDDYQIFLLFITNTPQLWNPSFRAWTSGKGHQTSVKCNVSTVLRFSQYFVIVNSKLRHFLENTAHYFCHVAYFAVADIFSAHEEGTFQALDLCLTRSLCKYGQHRVSRGLWCTGPGKSPYWRWNFTGRAVFVVTRPVSLPAFF